MCYLSFDIKSLVTKEGITKRNRAAVDAPFKKQVLTTLLTLTGRACLLVASSYREIQKKDKAKNRKNGDPG